MTSFRKDAFRTPLTPRIYLRSTRGVLTMSRTCDHETITANVVDGAPGQKVLQKGTVMATITSGVNAGKVGPYVDGSAGTSEAQSLTEATAISAGDYDVTLFPGEAGEVTVSTIAWDAVAADLQADFRAALAGSADEAVQEYADSLTVTGGPIASAPFVITYVSADGADVPELTVDETGLTGTITIATDTPGVAGATDGRHDTANIIGICNTLLPWQLMERDVDIAIVYEASVVQANCVIYDSAGAEIVLDDTTAAAMTALKHIDIRFAD